MEAENQVELTVRDDYDTTDEEDDSDMPSFQDERGVAEEHRNSPSLDIIYGRHGNEPYQDASSSQSSELSSAVKLDYSTGIEPAEQFVVAENSDNNEHAVI